MRIFILLNILFAALILKAQTRETDFRLPLPGEVQKQHKLNVENKAPLFEKPISYPAAKSTYGYIDTTYRIKYTDIFSDVNDWDSAYFISGYVRDSTHYYYDPDHPTLLGLMKVDYSGNVLWKRTDSMMRGDHFSLTLNTGMVQLSDGNFLHVGFVDNDYNNWKNYDWRAPVYTKFDADGNTIWKRIYKDTTYLKSEAWPRNVIPESEGGFTVAALILSDSKYQNPYDTNDTYLYTDTSYIGLIRYDSLGNELFRKKHFLGGDKIVTSIGLLIKQPDKGYIVGGVNYFSGDLKSYYLLKTDSLFNWEWRKLISQTSTSYPLIDILPFGNEKYYFSVLRVDTPIVYDSYGNKYYNGYHQTGVMDSSLNILKDTMFVRNLALYFGGPSYYSSLGDIRGLDTSSTGEMIVCAYINDGGAYLMNMGDGTNYKWGNWIAQYPYFREEPYRMRRAHDGGYLIVGRSSRQGVGGWFVKTDSLGFALPNGADTLYHIGFNNSELKENKSQMKIYPNPATTHITLDLGAQNQRIETLNIFTITGQKAISLTQVNNSKPIDIQNLKSGIYLLEGFLESGERFIGKFVKE
jgi:hypothetical protein